MYKVSNVPVSNVPAVGNLGTDDGTVVADVLGYSHFAAERPHVEPEILAQPAPRGAGFLGHRVEKVPGAELLDAIREALEAQPALLRD